MIKLFKENIQYFYTSKENLAIANANVANPMPTNGFIGTGMSSSHLLHRDLLHP